MQPTEEGGIISQLGKCYKKKLSPAKSMKAGRLDCFRNASTFWIPLFLHVWLAYNFLKHHPTRFSKTSDLESPAILYYGPKLSPTKVCFKTSSPVLHEKNDLKRLPEMGTTDLYFWLKSLKQFPKI